MSLHDTIIKQNIRNQELERENSYNGGYAQGYKDAMDKMEKIILALSKKEDDENEK